MSKLSKHDLLMYIERHIPDFHSARLQSLSRLQLKKVLQRKNPYLFKAKNVVTADAMVRAILDAYLSSQEETLFGSFLEGLAIFVCGKIYRGQKSTAEGIDLEFEKDGVVYLVAIKSGPNWGNSGQIAQMRRNFLKAKKILSTNSRVRNNVVVVNGCCYGREAHENRGDYLKLCGQNFWSFISGIDNLYVGIIEPLGYRAKERNEQFQLEYGKVVNRFSRQFISDFCQRDGTILWGKIVRFISARP